ncbi:MAG: carboxynorspermidine decarboxylase [Desulfamplus sp.]|nr:carboxynorspermidine decarboxylase [Desulfamplus sp.]
MKYSTLNFNPEEIITPCFVVDENLIQHNLDILSSVKVHTGCKILLALKCFAMFRAFPLISQELDGICASSPHEARLGREEFKKEVHTFAAAYSENDILELCKTTDHLVFNSFGQLERFKSLVKKRASELGRQIDLGIRINPEHSEGATPVYDPCAPGSRLGVRRVNFREDLLDGITGLHWHNLCEQDADCLDRTVRAVELRFGEFIPKMEYINFGGGHHITRPDYNIKLLEKIINDFQQKWGVQVYLEPGEAVALNAGYLVTTVLDIITQPDISMKSDSGTQSDINDLDIITDSDRMTDMDIVIMDACVPAHMPDVLEMPYRPHIINSEKPEPTKRAQKSQKHSYKIGGLSCLAGDVAGEYIFDKPLHIGEKLVFTDMAIYSMVKTNTFNGVQLPSIALVRKDDKKIEIVRQFDYSDFKMRLS